MIIPPWEPNEKQKIQYNAKQRYIHSIGEPRSGKTEGFFYKGRKELFKQPGIKWLITRDTGTSLAMATFKHFKNILEPRAINDEKQKPFPWLQLTNGSEIFFIPYDEMDTSKAGGTEYGIILIDEAQRFTFQQWIYMDTRLSQQWGNAIAPDGTPYKNRIDYNGLWTTANPAGRGYLWQIFVRDHPLAGLGKDKDYLRITFTRKDNEKNLKKEYIKAMESYPEHIRQRMLSADENPWEGLVFPMFDRTLHVLKVGNFIPPSNWRILFGLDFGFQTPTAADWIGITEDGFVIVFKDYTEVGKTINENSKAICYINEEFVKKGVQFPDAEHIDPSTDQKDGKSASGETVFEQFRKHGLINLRKAKKIPVRDRVSQLRDLLKRDPHKKLHPITGEFHQEGWPTLLFCADCEHTIAEFEDWEMTSPDSTKRDPKEKPQEKNDHQIDAVWYCLNGYFYEGSPDHELTEGVRDTEESRLRKSIEKTLDEALDKKHPSSSINQTGAVF